MRAMARINEMAGRSESGHKHGVMPTWPDGVRAIPNILLRSPLFAALGRGTRNYMKREEIVCLGDVKVRYTGAQLDQWDLSVWMAVLHIARQQTIDGVACRTTAYQLLKLLGRTDSGKNREILQQRLSVLSATAVEIEIAKFSFEGSLIDEATRADVRAADGSRAYSILLNPTITRLFVEDTTWISWGVRNELNSQPLAQWLHCFYATHKQPFALKISTLHSLCGSESRCLRDFTKNLRRSLSAVRSASMQHGATFDWRVDSNSGLVHVSRKLSTSKSTSK